MKVYKVLRTGDTAISITAGNNRMYKVPLPPEGAITKFVLYQSSGTAVAFECDLFDTAILPEGTHATAVPATAELYRIFPTKTALASAKITEYTTGELGYSYRNSDGTHTVSERCLWLHIRPTAAGTTTTWSLAIIVENDIG
jgi:hypothetical protein